jgi:hypothetical protein
MRGSAIGAKRIPLGQGLGEHGFFTFLLKAGKSRRQPSLDKDEQNEAGILKEG